MKTTKPLELIDVLIARMPRRIREHVARLEKRVAELEEELNPPADGSFVFIQSGGLQPPRPLGASPRITFRTRRGHVDLTFDQTERAVTIRTTDGLLSVHPRAANTVDVVPVPYAQRSDLGATKRTELDVERCATTSFEALRPPCPRRVAADTVVSASSKSRTALSPSP